MANTIPTQKPRYRDLNLSFLPNPVRKDISTLSDEDAVEQSLMNLVRTKYYARPFHPEIGCNVTSMLFEPNSPVTAFSIQRSIQDVITNFESSRVTIESIDVVSDLANDGYNVTITFWLKSVPTLQTISTFLERLR